MNEVRVLTAVLILGLAPIACTRTTATPTTDAAAESERATREYAHGALIQTPTPTVDATAIADAMATGQALPRDPTADEMRDGEHLGFLKAIAPGSPPMLVVDTAVWFGGADASAASLADGERTAEYEMPNDFYIRNLDVATVTLPLSPSATVTLTLTADATHTEMTPTTVSVDALVGLFAGTPIAPPADRIWMGSWGDAAAAAKSDFPEPFQITTKDGTVVGLDQQFVP